MHIWIVSWIEGTTPIIEVFTDIEQAMQCMRFIAVNKSGLTVKHIEVKKEEPAKDDPAEPIEAEAE